MLAIVWVLCLCLGFLVTCTGHTSELILTIYSSYNFELTDDKNLQVLLVDCQNVPH